ncbi:MAG: glycosyltransferase family 9 protein [Bacteroidota bacterium]|nr:glycosyltransferase family 9 protein [Bacteroidota bacterium]
MHDQDNSTIHSSPFPIQKILIIALPGLGDALMSTPMLALLRKERPEAEIHVLVMFPATRELFMTNPNLDHIHYFDFINANKFEGFLYLLHLRRMGFDVSINIYPENRREYNAFAYLLGAKKRIGMRYGHRNWANLNWLNTDLVTEDDSYHCVEENVRLLSALGIYPEIKEETLPNLQLHLLPEHLSFADEWLKEHPADFRIGFHAGTALFKNHIRRRWAPEKFAELAKRLKHELGASLFLFGGPDDLEPNEIIMRLAGDAITEVKTKSIMDSVALMQKMSLFVSNDSALMHIAGALDLPTVAIFGPTNETYVHPWKTKYEIVHTGIECRPCFYYSPKPLTCYRSSDEQFICMKDIEVSSVFESVKRLMQ